jgi:hypothetical protein
MPGIVSHAHGLRMRSLPMLGQYRRGGKISKAPVELMHSGFHPIDESKLASAGSG